jgi:hypothetical protein
MAALMMSGELFELARARLISLAQPHIDSMHCNGLRLTTSISRTNSVNAMGLKLRALPRTGANLIDRGKAKHHNKTTKKAAQPIKKPNPRSDKPQPKNQTNEKSEKSGFPPTTPQTRRSR